jgi:hypothetical protein
MAIWVLGKGQGAILPGIKLPHEENLPGSWGLEPELHELELRLRWL